MMRFGVIILTQPVLSTIENLTISCFYFICFDIRFAHNLGMSVITQKRSSKREVMTHFLDPSLPTTINTAWHNNWFFARWEGHLTGWHSGFSNDRKYAKSL